MPDLFRMLSLKVLRLGRVVLQIVELVIDLWWGRGSLWFLATPSGIAGVDDQFPVSLTDRELPVRGMVDYRSAFDVLSGQRGIEAGAVLAGIGRKFGSEHLGKGR